MGINPANELERMRKERQKEAHDEEVNAANSSSQNCFQKLMKRFLRQKQLRAQAENNLAENIQNVPAAIRCIHKPDYPESNRLDVKYVIVDCSGVNFIDSQGVNGLLQVSNSLFSEVLCKLKKYVVFVFNFKKLYESYAEIGIKLHLSYCKRKLIFMIEHKLKTILFFKSTFIGKKRGHTYKI